MGQIRVELMTPALSERCSNQLSYCPLKKSRQLPTFPPQGSIIGAGELDFRVRYGNGYCLSAMATGILNRIIYFRNTPPKRRISEESEKGTRRRTIIWPSLTDY